MTPRLAPYWVRLAASLIRRLPAGRYRAIERLCRRPPAPFLMPLPDELGGGSFLCDLRDSIAREVCFTGRYGPQETALLRGLLGPGMSFVDVGANWGYFTMTAARCVGPQGRVLSLEPDPRMFRMLSANIASNGMRQVTLLPVAAASAPGALTLAGFSEEIGNFGLSRLGERPPAGGQLFSVQADALDNVLSEQGFARVDVMKIDIEGAEGQALGGLVESLREHRVRCLMLELHPRELSETGFTTQEAVEGLLSAGYRGFTVDHEPSVTRRSAYGRVRDFASVLRPLSQTEPLDAWPHQLWFAPHATPGWLR